ncbi:hypothetical protein K1719_010968 [Acacia pycnantha]|nr:hypothetical protein K1719_010968 [Acacia pycnantha]
MLIGRWRVTTDPMGTWNLLKHILGRGEIQCIGGAIVKEYKEYIKKDPAIKHLQQIFCAQHSFEETIIIFVVCVSPLNSITE